MVYFSSIVLPASDEGGTMRARAGTAFGTSLPSLGGCGTEMTTVRLEIDHLSERWQAEATMPCAWPPSPPPELRL